MEENQKKTTMNQEKMEWMVEKNAMIAQNDQVEMRARIMKEESIAAREELSFWKDRGTSQDDHMMRLREELAQKDRSVQSAGDRDDSSRRVFVSRIGLEMEIGTKEEVIRTMRQELAEEGNRMPPQESVRLEASGMPSLIPTKVPFRRTSPTSARAKPRRKSYHVYDGRHPGCKQYSERSGRGRN